MGEQAPRENPWDRFAKEDPTFYIATHTRRRWREEDAFWQSGQKTADFIWGHVLPMIPHHRVAVEIGCGIGRLAVPMAKRFTRVKVVDASSVMLQQLQLRCQQFGACNIETYLDDAPWDAEKADFVYSALTFQHISEFTVIERSIERIARCLSGIAFLQFDTRPQTKIEQQLIHWRGQVPERFLPRTWRRGIRRIRRHSDALRAMFARHHLRIENELSPDSALHAFVLRK